MARLKTVPLQGSDAGNQELRTRDLIIPPFRKERGKDGAPEVSEGRSVRVERRLESPGLKASSLRSFSWG